jgi:hypothetical protein
MRGWIYGGIGFALGLAAALAETRPMGRAERRDSGEIKRLEDEIRRQEEMILRNEEELGRLRAEAAQSRPADAPAARQPSAPAARNPAVAEAAASLGVPDDTLQAAFDAYADPSQENLHKLAGHGVDAFRALVAMLRGGLSGTKFDALFARCWTPAAAGQERMLFETVDNATADNWSRWTALRVLGYADTPEAREHVVSRLQRETNAGLFMSAAKAAGTLKEARALPDLLRGMRNRDWGEPVRRDIVLAAVEVAGDRAMDILVDYLREPNADLLGSALFRLHFIDADAASREAVALLAGPRADSLTANQLADLRRYAGAK